MTKRTECRERRAVGPWARLVSFPRCQSGQAIYVVVVFFFLMAGLLFLVINSGEKVNHKVQMQSAADAAAASGAGWYARGLNVISMCNITESQLLSLIVLCDALETVTPPAKVRIDDLVNHIGQSKKGADIPLDPRLDMWLIVGNAQAEQTMINELNNLVKSVSWPEYLTYDSGVLWQCAKLMNAFSHAMAKETPLAAQREAIDVATKDQADFAFVLPLWPALPVTTSGLFSDFKDPMSTGHLPNNGPVIGGFAYVMDYRGYNGQVLGPWGYWREPFIRSRPMGLFSLSGFGVMFDIVSQQYLDMLFDPGADDQASLGETTWELDYDKAKQIPPDQLVAVWWESVSFNARYPNAEETAPFPLPATGAWGALEDPPNPVPSRPYNTGTFNGQPPAGYIRSTEPYDGADPREATWYRDTRQRTAQYPQLGIFAPHPPTHPDGTPWPYTDAEKHTYYGVRLIRFLGAELTSDTTLKRNYLGQPADMWPIMLDPVIGTNTVANVNDYFTLDGFAYRAGKVNYWATPTSGTLVGPQSGLPVAQGFKNPNPIDQVIGYAQARVYNRYTWDLFTQYWKVKLMRTTNPPSAAGAQPSRWAWMQAQLKMGLPGGASELEGVLTPDHLKPVSDMLDSYDSTFVEEVTH